MSPGYERLTAPLDEASVQILRRVKAERGISTTEAMRRAIGLLGLFERKGGPADPYGALLLALCAEVGELRFPGQAWAEAQTDSDGLDEEIGQS
jgi:hypothetical protein